MSLGNYRLGKRDFVRASFVGEELLAVGAFPVFDIARLAAADRIFRCVRFLVLMGDLVDLVARNYLFGNRVLAVSVAEILAAVAVPVFGAVAVLGAGCSLDGYVFKKVTLFVYGYGGRASTVGERTSAVAALVIAAAARIAFAGYKLNQVCIVLSGNYEVFRVNSVSFGIEELSAQFAFVVCRRTFLALIARSRDKVVGVVFVTVFVVYLKINVRISRFMRQSFVVEILCAIYAVPVSFVAGFDTGRWFPRSGLRRRIIYRTYRIPSVPLRLLCCT